MFLLFSSFSFSSFLRLEVFFEEFCKQTEKKMNKEMSTVIQKRRREDDVVLFQINDEVVKYQLIIVYYSFAPLFFQGEYT